MWKYTFNNVWLFISWSTGNWKSEMKAYSLRNTLLSLLLSSYNTNAADFDVCKKEQCLKKSYHSSLCQWKEYFLKAKWMQCCASFLKHHMFLRYPRQKKLTSFISQLIKAIKILNFRRLWARLIIDKSIITQHTWGPHNII